MYPPQSTHLVHNCRTGLDDMFVPEHSNSTSILQELFCRLDTMTTTYAAISCNSSSMAPYQAHSPDRTVGNKEDIILGYTGIYPT